MAREGVASGASSTVRVIVGGAGARRVGGEVTIGVRRTGGGVGAGTVGVGGGTVGGGSVAAGTVGSVRVGAGTSIALPVCTSACVAATPPPREPDP